MSNRFFPGVLIAAALTIPVFTNGCSSTADALCCNEFKVGATINADIGGSVQSQVAVQAVADFGGIASAAVDDVTTACRNIAQDLDAPKADQDAAEGKTDKRERLNAWCSLAVKTIGTFKAAANISVTVTFAAPKCEASVSAKANCQAKCDVSGKCDIKANPPKCTGGTLSVACKGGCTGEAGASVSCEGSCTGGCTGSCTAEGGVECTGKCEGTCSASGAGGTGTGIQADGSCKGTCKGTCSVTPPGVKCTGSCNGKC
ncbi:MAG: Tryptophan synthase alpha chain, partial [Myxococcaceae bacterium]|nr:Tryptophan synthase alpha chain [Myxococcaceae bacterium]